MCQSFLQRFIEEDGISVYSQIQDNVVIPGAGVFTSDLVAHKREVRSAESMGVMALFVGFLHRTEVYYFWENPQFDPFMR